jgi:ABC-2 type transport system permease protein
MNKAKDKKRQILIQAGLMLGIIVFLNIIFNIYYKRIDLTGDKRYTLSAPTKKLLKDVKDVIYVKVYLEGKGLPAGFRRLHDATRDMLDEFRVVAGDKIQYQFINPDDMPDEQSKRNLYKQLHEQGLNPVNLQVNEEDKLSQKIIFPGAVVTYNNSNVTAQLLQEQIGNVSPEEVLNNSVTQVEYQLANTIRKLESGIRPKIGFVQGHGELTPDYVKDISGALSEYYQVDFVNSPKYKIGRYDSYAALIIAKPDSTFTELEKYKLDQYIMKGGRVLFCIDNLMAEMDSMKGGTTYSADYPLNLSDLFFKYGIRINNSLVQDLNCHYIPLVSSAYGSQNRGSLLKWPYYPLVTPTSDNPIVNGLNAVWFQFANTIDTLSSKHNSSVKKTVLLQSSPNTRVMQHPVLIDLRLVKNIDPRLYTQGYQNLAVLLEGSFTSAYANRITPELIQTGDYGDFKDKGKPAKLIVVSDGDVIKNQYSEAKHQAYPLGYDRYTKQYFGNKNFILNCIDYMVDESGLISLRSKQFQLRLLDAGQAKSDRLYWQVINTVVPISLIILFGIVYNYVRKRRFSV